jgi:hypothetical protein
MHHEKFHLYSLLNISRMIRWMGHVACVRDEKCIMIFVQKTEGKRPLGRTRYTWEDNIQIDFMESRWKCGSASSG